jgi:ATP phosphoribosyltransferase regulatory subunit
MFAAYIPGQGQAIARGGRYDEIGEVFGRARSATGFSTDLRLLVRSGNPESQQIETIIAPWSDDPSLAEAVVNLRNQGKKVINELPGHDNNPAYRKLEKENNKWTVK